MNKTVLITGATGAIGSATALSIAQSNSTVVLLARNKSKLENLKKDISQKSGNNNIDILVADLSDVSSVKKAAKEFRQKYNRLDVLINIAAVYKRSREVTRAGIEMMFATNHMGPFTLTTELLDLLKAGQAPRIITLTAPSTTKINFDDIQGTQKWSSLHAFGASKMMNLMFTYALARRLKDSGILALAFFPGLTRSNLMREMSAFTNLLLRIAGAKSERPAKMLRQLAIDPLDQKANGKFYKFNGKEIPSSEYSYNTDLQEKLWKLSGDLVSKETTKSPAFAEAFEIG